MKRCKKIFYFRLFVLLFCTPFFLFGCAGGVQYQDKELDFAVSEKWQSSPEEQEQFGEQSWLDDFQDDRLQNIVEKVLRANYDLRIFARRIEFAQSSFKIAGARYFPTLSGDLRVGRKGTVVDLNDKYVSAGEQNQASLRFDTSWEIDLWGKIRALKKAEYAKFLAAKSDYEGSLLSYGAMTAKSWFSAIEAKLLTELSENIALSLKKSEEIITKRFYSGLCGAMDVRAIRRELLSAQSSLLEQKKNYQESIRVLKVLMGEYPIPDLELPEKLPVLKGKLPKGIPSDLLQRRPDILAAKNRLIAADARTAAAVRTLFPSISLTGSVGTSSDELKDVVNPTSFVWNIGSGLFMPIFQGGKLRQDVKRSSAAGKEAWLNYQKVILNAFHEAETTIDAESVLEKREEIMKNLVVEAKATFDNAWDSYLAGNIDITAVLNAKRSFIQAQKGLISMSASRLRNRVDLYLVLGGGLKQDKKE